MDLYGSDKKLSELDHTDFGEFLNQSVFTAPPPSLEPYGIDVAADMEDDWFENFFDAPADPVDCILHDKMMSEALQSPQVKTEHSYSCANGVNGVNNVNVVQTIDDEDKELDLELQRTLNPMNMTPTTQALNLCTTELNRAVNSIKEEPTESEVTTVTVTRTTNPQTLLKQPTIILATQPQVQHIGQPLRTQERLVLPKVNIKVESHQQQFVSSPEHSSDYGYDNLSLPPTPPSSNNSDSDGSQSPDRSAPNSPMRSTHLSRHAYRSMSPTQPLFMSPIPTSGVLILTEEEKRTLISEGYPIPQKLPLTKQEEKNLKKIRRKIKNKISAQESRRKKKEYLETLERKVESFSSENMDLKKKVDVLENNNRSLMSQLQKLQTLAGKLTRPSNTSTQTGTCLMVFVLCFAVFLGTWSPMSLSVGYSGINAGVAPSMLTKTPVIESSLIGGGGGLPPFDAPSQAESGGKRGGRGSAMGPELQTPISDVYSTPNMRSRVLMSVTEEESAEEFGPIEPFSYKDFFVKWFSSASQKIGPEDEALIFEPPLPKVEVLDVETEINQTGEGRAYANVPQQAPPPMHPDISVTTKPQRLDNAA